MNYKIILAFIATCIVRVIIPLTMIAITFHNIAIGITEAVVLHKSKDASDECSYIWGCILIACAIHFAVNIIGIYLICKENRMVFYVTFCGSIGITSTLTVVYYTLDHDCMQIYQDNYPDLWKMVVMEAMLTYCYVAFIIVMLIIYCIIVKYKIDILERINFNTYLEPEQSTKLLNRQSDNDALDSSKVPYTTV